MTDILKDIVNQKQFNGQTLAISAILLAATLGGGIPTLTKISLEEMPPFSFTFLRFFVAAACILPFFLKDKPKMQKDFYKVIFFSLFLSCNVILFPLGVRLTTATIGQTLYIFTPILVAVLAFFFLSEIFNFKKVIGIVVGFFGALIIFLLPEITGGAPFTGNMIGNLIIFLAVLATAFYTVFSKKFQKRYTPLQLTAIFIFTTCFILIFLAASDVVRYPFWWQHTSITPILSVLYVGLIGTAAYYLLTQYAVKHGSPIIASMILYLQPITSFFWAYFLLGEQLTAGLIIGSILAFTGVFLTLQSQR